jgi:hypothetical protein
VLLSAAVPAASTVIYAMQLVLSGKESWAHAFAQEAVFSGTWWFLGVLIFRLCGWLHREPYSISRVVLGLLAGSVGVLILQPCLIIAGSLVASWANEMVARRSYDWTEIVKTWPGLFLNLLGIGIIIYGGIVTAWHALTYHRGLQQERLESAELQALLRQAQLQALRSQLNPHFLFNTLHSIAELVHENPQLAEQMLLRLSALLRKALVSSGAQEVPLGEELEFVKGYVEIEQLRLGDRLRVTWEIAPDSLKALVPSLLLQPLVENAIQHGVAPSTIPGTLLICTRRNGEFFELQVHDSGAGLAVDGADRPGGVGLANTRDRLQRLYGERQQFELTNDKGLRVNVRLPYSAMPHPGPHAT